MLDTTFILLGNTKKYNNKKTQNKKKNKNLRYFDPHWNFRHQTAAGSGKLFYEHSGWWSRVPRKKAYLGHSQLGFPSKLDCNQGMDILCTIRKQKDRRVIPVFFYLLLLILENEKVTWKKSFKSLKWDT